MRARRLTDASRRHLDLAQSLRRRNVEVGLQYQRLGSDNTVGVTLSLPLFLSHDYRGEIQEAHSRLSQARTETLETELQVRVDLETAYEAYRSSRQLLRNYTEETMKQAEESFRIATLSYQEGAISLLELLDTQRTYNQTRIALNEVLYEHTLSLNRLEMALGTDLR